MTSDNTDNMKMFSPPPSLPFVKAGKVTKDEIDTLDHDSIITRNFDHNGCE